MVERTRTHEQTVGPNLIGNLRGQVAHRDGVLERTRRHLTQPTQQSLVGIGQFEEGNVGDKAECLLYQVHQRIRDEQQHTVYRKVIIHALVEFGKIVVLHELQCQIDDTAGKSHEQGRLEHLCPAREFAQRIDGHQTAHDLHDDKLVLIFDGRRTDKHHRDVGDESRARVHEHAYKDGGHRKGDDVDAEDIVHHHERHQHREKRHHDVEHQDVARLLEIISAEKGEISGKKHHKDGNKEHLSDHRGSNLGGGGTAPLHLALIRREHPIVVIVYDLASVDYLLPAEHHATGRRDAAEQIILLSLAALLVVHQIGLDILVEITLLQDGSKHAQPLVEKQLLIGCHGGIDAVYLHTLRLLAADDSDQSGRVFADGIVFGHAHDARLVETVQAVYDDRQILLGKSMHILTERIAQLAQLGCLHRRVVTEVGLEKLHERVLFCLYGLIGLVDGEVELGNKRPIHPGLAHVIAQTLALVAWKEPDNDSDTDGHQTYTSENLLPITAIGCIEIHSHGHSYTFILRKYEKKYA